MSKDGGPAFPCPHESAPEIGMTLRDYFAAKVTVKGKDFPKTTEQCEALIGRPYPDYLTDYLNWLRAGAEIEAIIRGVKADAMLSERAK